MARVHAWESRWQMACMPLVTDHRQCSPLDILGSSGRNINAHVLLGRAFLDLTRARLARAAVAAAAAAQAPGAEESAPRHVLLGRAFLDLTRPDSPERLATAVASRGGRCAGRAARPRRLRKASRGDTRP